MKDNISLIGAVVGGFMLSIAVTGIIKAAPVISLNAPPTLNSTPVTNFHTSSASSASLRFEKRS